MSMAARSPPARPPDSIAGSGNAGLVLRPGSSTGCLPRPVREAEGPGRRVAWMSVERGEHDRPFPPT
jgi:hypothetical protein